MSRPEVVNEEIVKGTEIIQMIGDNGDEYYFRKPTVADVKRMMDKTAKDGYNPSNMMEQAIKTALIYPSLDEFEKMLKDYPAAFIPMYNALYSKTGLTKNFTTEILKN